jgi:hypothetical protein
MAETLVSARRYLIADLQHRFAVVEHQRRRRNDVHLGDRIRIQNHLLVRRSEGVGKVAPTLIPRFWPSAVFVAGPPGWRLPQAGGMICMNQRTPKRSVSLSLTSAIVPREHLVGKNVRRFDHLLDAPKDPLASP